MKRYIYLFLVVPLMACGEFKKPDAGAYYGDAPKKPEEQIRNAIKKSFFDADSAKIDIKDKYKAYCNQGLAYGGNIAWTGWAVSADINAKNRMGGYVGYRPFTFYFGHNGQVYDYNEGVDSVLCHSL